MAKVTIGGTVYTTESLVFKALKSAWPHIKKSQEAAKAAQLEGADAQDPIEAMDTAIAVISAAFIKAYPDLTVEFIENTITALECQDLGPVIIDLMVEAGFMRRTSAPGEPVPEEVVEATSPSTATSTESSPSSSPVDAEAGTTS